MKTKRIIALSIALAMIFICLSGCGDSVGENSEGGHTTLTCAAKKDPGNWGPYGSGGQRYQYNSIGFETMMYVNKDGGVENVLITDYKELGDGVYEIYLYDYIHDTQGNPVTASDVVFSFEKANENGSYVNILTGCTVEAVDDYIVKMTLENEKAGSFFVIMSTINIITQKAWEASGDDMAQNAVGTSPYKITDYAVGSYVTYEKVDDYWQKDESLIASCSIANIDTVKWVIIDDFSAAAIALENGEIDHSVLVLPPDYSRFVAEDGSAKEGFNLSIDPTSYIFGVTFNCGEKSACADINLRKAICYAIDSATIIESHYRGYGDAVGNYVHPAFLDYDESFEHLDSYYAFDPATAKDYLDKSDYNGETLQVLLAANGDVTDISVLVQAYLDDIGIKIEFIPSEASTFNGYLTDATGELYDFVLTADQGSSNADYLSTVLYAGNSSNYNFGNLFRVSDTKLDELWQAMTGVKTHSTETVGDYLNYIEDQCYQYGMFRVSRVNVASSRVTKFVTDGQGYIVCGACEVLPD